MALFLGLHLHYPLHIVLVLQIGASSSEGVHPCLHAYCLKHGAIEIVSRTGCIHTYVPNSTKLISLWFIFLE